MIFILLSFVSVILLSFIILQQTTSSFMCPRATTRSAASMACSMDQLGNIAASDQITWKTLYPVVFSARVHPKYQGAPHSEWPSPCPPSFCIVRTAAPLSAFQIKPKITSVHQCNKRHASIPFHSHRRLCFAPPVRTWASPSTISMGAHFDHKIGAQPQAGHTQ